MKHAREDYNRIQDPEGLIPDNEPVFLLRAADKVSAGVVRHWAFAARAVGASEKIVSMALHHANEMEEWPVKKVPDLPEATP